MADTQMREGPDHLPEGGDAIQTFAGRVLDVLVARSRRPTAVLRDDLVVALAEGMVTLDDARIERTLTDFRRAFISPVAMTDIYVPAAARYLGQRWACDDMGFAEVTIATARLQALVRAIGTRRGCEPFQMAERKAVLMIVPASEHHSLGAIVATDQLRRLGLSVCLRLAPTTGEVGELVRSRSFDAVMLSVGHGDRLDSTRKLIETVRSIGPAGLPVVVGGTALESGRDVRALTGADFVSQDVGEALKDSGLVRVTTAAEFGVEVAARLRA